MDSGASKVVFLGGVRGVKPESAVECDVHHVFGHVALWDGALQLRREIFVDLRRQRSVVVLQLLFSTFVRKLLFFAIFLDESIFLILRSVFIIHELFDNSSLSFAFFVELVNKPLTYHLLM